MGYFKDVTPESAGISSKGILNFLDRMEESQIELHSFMVIRHGQCAAKGWWKPYDVKIPSSTVFVQQIVDSNGDWFCRAGGNLIAG